MNRFEIDQWHVKCQFESRYRSFADKADAIIKLVMKTLSENTPDDWRFTESPSSRFFLVEETSCAKFMGMSYRDGPGCRQIVSHVRANTGNLKYLFNHLEGFVEAYIAEVLSPDLPIMHQIRTVYPQRKGDMAEEKHLFRQALAVTSHLIPLKSKKIASRPNAIITEDGVLWVRQYMNWVSMKPGSKEYYLFNPLTRNGIQKNRYAIYSYSENGRLEKLGEEFLQSANQAICDSKDNFFNHFKCDHIKMEAGLRTENYWKVPTFLDSRIIDLTYKERHLEEISCDNESNAENENMTNDLVELMFLRKIIEKARRKLNIS